ncbi:hypothetical protein GCM10010234_20510 [Streptomyces hawaiiensis]
MAEDGSAVASTVAQAAAVTAKARTEVKRNPSASGTGVLLWGWAPVKCPEGGRDKSAPAPPGFSLRL